MQKLLNKSRFLRDNSKLGEYRGFSLVEVVVAVGIFAIAVVSVLGLLVPITQSVSDVRDTDNATRVAGIVQAELQRLGFSVVEANLWPNVPNDSTFDPTDTGTPPLAFFASRNGDKVGIYEGSGVWKLTSTGSETTAAANAQKFFEIVLLENTAITPSSTPGFLAFTMRLRWPAFLPNGTINDQHNQKSVLLVPMAITR
ncbi:prepilin-type N-terminal cleavage/methylation domain-containing protein [Opitutaceae bacterium TAV1]|nr:prepilin-type N-terminal cleavage/methylation domain-containing protein [Opitutaceae bacterium TAV1]